MSEENLQIGGSSKEGNIKPEYQPFFGEPVPAEVKFLGQVQDETHDRYLAVLDSSEQELQFDEQYQTINRLLDRLGGWFYSGGTPLLWEEEISELADNADFILAKDPDLKHVISDKKYSKIWEKLAKVMYSGIHKTKSKEIFEKLSNALVLILRVAAPHSNKGPADSLFAKILSRWPWNRFLPKDYDKFKPKQTEKSDKNETVLRKYFDRIGIDPEMAFKAWYESNEKASAGEFSNDHTHPVLTAEKNIFEMRRLELHHPGGSKVLVDNFGVYCFARYPKGMLDDQLDQFDDFTKPYGVIISAASDHNGVSYNQRTIDTYASLLKQCRSLGIHIRVMEANDQRNLRKRFFFLENKYNTQGKRKAVFGIAAGHANTELFALGKGDSELENIRSKNFKLSNFVEDSKRFFEDGAYFIIDGCMAGKKGGFAEKAAQISPHLHFLAPSEAVSCISSIKLIKNNSDVPRILITYKNAGLLPHFGHKMKYYKGSERLPIIESKSE